MQWEYIKKVFNMILKHQSPTIKIFLIFALITWEKELADVVLKLFLTPKHRRNFVFCLPHLQSLVNGFTQSPYTRNNIDYIIEYFVVQACRLCQMNIIPGLDAQLEIYNQSKQQQQQSQQSPLTAGEDASKNFSFELNV